MRRSLRRRARAWGRRQLYSFFSSLGTLFGHRIGTLMTVLVLGIAMALPLGLLVSLENLAALDLRQDEWASITIFLQPEADAEAAADLARSIEVRGPASVRVISPDEGMEEFTAASGFSGAAEVFDENPLPWVVVLTPGGESAADVDRWVSGWQSWLETRQGIDLVQVDHKWMQRLAGLLALGKALITVLAVVFSVSVIVVVANTIRLDVASRAEEIEVMSMVGASNSFIRQPFLYTGFWYGLLGAGFALLLLYGGMLYLSAPLERLLDAYGRQFSPQGLGADRVVLVLVLGGALGLAGAWVSVQRHLRVLRAAGESAR